MSVFSGFQTIRRERAILERNRVVMTSMLEDEMITESYDTFLGHDYFEGVDESELEALIAKIPESDPADDDAQIEKILLSDNDMDVDGILDVEDSPGVDDEY